MVKMLNTVDRLLDRTIDRTIDAQCIWMDGFMDG